tara:strand:- start:65 stop:337 length:273 start_codon:yes stop_codon:yes gene_type:complete
MNVNDTINQYKSKEERKKEVKKIIIELAEFELSVKYEPIKLLYEKFKNYIEFGDYVKISIPFPMINKRIKGELKPKIGKDSVLRLVHEEY